MAMAQAAMAKVGAETEETAAVQGVGQAVPVREADYAKRLCTALLPAPHPMASACDQCRSSLATGMPS